MSEDEEVYDDLVADVLIWGHIGNCWVDLEDTDLEESINWVLQQGYQDQEQVDTWEPRICIQYIQLKGRPFKFGKLGTVTGHTIHVYVVSDRPLSREEAENVYNRATSIDSPSVPAMDDTNGIARDGDVVDSNSGALGSSSNGVGHNALDPPNNTQE